MGKQEAKKPTNIEAAKKLIEAAEQKKTEDFEAALVNAQKNYGRSLLVVTVINGQQVPVHQLLTTPLSFVIVANG